MRSSFTGTDIETVAILIMNKLSYHLTQNFYSNVGFVW